MRWLLASVTLATLLVPAGLSAQTVTMPQSVEVSVGRLAAVPMKYDGDDFRYVVPPELDAFREYTTDPTEVKLRVIGYTPGIFRIIAVTTKTVDGKAKLGDFNATLVRVGGTLPPVVPPDQPDPPVDPPPVVTPVGGLRVLMIYESDTPIPRATYDAMFDPTVDEYLTAKCIKGTDGKTPERRRFDEDDLLTNMSPAWKALRLKLPAALPLMPDGKTQAPHIAVGDSSGAVVYSGPVPASAAAMLELLKKYGGP